MEVTKVYLMLPIQDMQRAVSFYRDTVGLGLVFESPYWSELRLGDTTIALHMGGGAERRESWLGLHVTDLDSALAEIEAGGGRCGVERTEAGARLVQIEDPEGNLFTLGQTIQ